MGDDSLEHHIDNKFIPALMKYLDKGECDGVFFPMAKVIYTVLLNYVSYNL